MSYMISLSLREAAFLGATGCVCLGAGCVLFEITWRIAKLGRDNLESKISQKTQNTEKSIVNRTVSFLGFIGQKIVNKIQRAAVIIFASLSFVFWMAGAASLTYAAIGPLLV